MPPSSRREAETLAACAGSPGRDDRDPPTVDGDGLPTDGDSLPCDGDRLPADGDSLPAGGDSLPAGGDSLPADGDSLPADGRPLPEQDVAPSSRLPDRRTLAGCRAQTEPIAALVALLAVCTAMTLYAGVAQDAAPTVEPAAAAPAMERLSTVAVEDGTVAPAAVPGPEAIVAGGREARITLAYGDRVRTYGPEPPRSAARSTRPVSVRVRPGVRRPGRLVVEVWS